MMFAATRALSFAEETMHVDTIAALFHSDPVSAIFIVALAAIALCGGIAAAVTGVHALRDKLNKKRRRHGSRSAFPQRWQRL